MRATPKLSRDTCALNGAHSAAQLFGLTRTRGLCCQTRETRCPVQFTGVTGGWYASVCDRGWILLPEHGVLPFVTPAEKLCSQRACAVLQPQAVLSKHIRLAHRVGRGGLTPYRMLGSKCFLGGRLWVSFSGPQRF